MVGGRGRRWLCKTNEGPRSCGGRPAMQPAHHDQRAAQDGNTRWQWGQGEGHTSRVESAPTPFPPLPPSERPAINRKHANQRRARADRKQNGPQRGPPPPPTPTPHSLDFAPRTSHGGSAKGKTDPPQRISSPGRNASPHGPPSTETLCQRGRHVLGQARCQAGSGISERLGARARALPPRVAGVPMPFSPTCPG